MVKGRDPDLDVEAGFLPKEAELRELLYQCVRELDYVQSVENCNSGLCASAMGKDLIERGMKLLGVRDLRRERLDD